MGFAYDAALTALIATASPWLLWRARAGRPGPWQLWRGPQYPATPPTDTPVVWFHGVSVGEVHLLGPVVAAFRQQFPHFDVAISSTTPTGLAEARKRFVNTVVAPFPFDLSWQVRRAFDAIRPAAVVMAESELWPGFLAEAQRREVPVAVINGRMSPRSANRWRRVAPLARATFGRVHSWAVQDQEHRNALLTLGVAPDAVQVTGSVKFDGALASQTSQAEALKQLLGIRANQTILVAGSTQECEEKHLLSAWKRLVPDYPDLRLILVPRHPERFESVAQWLATEQVTFSRRSQLVQPANIPAGVVLLDTLGELSALWSLADLGFVGGSLDGKRGGQSMIEPAARGVPACFGPHIWNFKDISKQLVTRGGATMLSGPADLEPTLRQWLANPADRQRMGQAARAFVATQQGATQRTLDFLAERLPLLASTSRRAG
jgi:3-deoxy-D-manno-octulosonic-acid transferase